MRDTRAATRGGAAVTQQLRACRKGRARRDRARAATRRAGVTAAHALPDAPRAAPGRHACARAALDRAPRHALAVRPTAGDEAGPAAGGTGGASLDESGAVLVC